MNTTPISSITTRYDLDGTNAVQIVTIPEKDGQRASCYANRVTVAVDASGNTTVTPGEQDTILVGRIPVISDMQTVLKGLHSASLTDVGNASTNPENPLAYLFA